MRRTQKPEVYFDPSGGVEAMLGWTGWAAGYFGPPAIESEFGLRNQLLLLSTAPESTMSQLFNPPVRPCPASPFKHRLDTTARVKIDLRFLGAAHCVTGSNYLLALE